MYIFFSNYKTFSRKILQNIFEKILSFHNINIGNNNINNRSYLTKLLQHLETLKNQVYTNFDGYHINNEICVVYAIYHTRFGNW